ncbi:hypothetical protein AB0O76_43505, partial [Streptomyces sp. NPDC086554]
PGRHRAVAARRPEGAPRTREAATPHRLRPRRLREAVHHVLPRHRRRLRRTARPHRSAPAPGQPPPATPPHPAPIRVRPRREPFPTPPRPAGHSS